MQRRLYIVRSAHSTGHIPLCGIFFIGVKVWLEESLSFFLLDWYKAEQFYFDNHVSEICKQFFLPGLDSCVLVCTINKIIIVFINIFQDYNITLVNYVIIILSGSGSTCHVLQDNHIIFSGSSATCHVSAG